jgi:hypothetical protein
MKAYGGVDLYIHVVLTLALVGVEWSASLPCRFTRGNHWIGGWVDPRASLDDMETWKFMTLPGPELRPLSFPARSQSLYRLRYRSSRIKTPHIQHFVLDGDESLVSGFGLSAPYEVVSSTTG